MTSDLWNGGDPMYERDGDKVAVLNDNVEANIIPHLVDGKSLKVGMTVRSYDFAHARPKCGEGNARCDGKGEILCALADFGCGKPLTFKHNGNQFTVQPERWIEGRVMDIGSHTFDDNLSWDVVIIHADKVDNQPFSMDRLISGGEPKLYYPSIHHSGFVIVGGDE